MNQKIILAIIGIITVLGASLIFAYDKFATETFVMDNNFDSSNMRIMETNNIKHIVPIDKIKHGGPPKDGIPSIDNPKFANVKDSQFMSDSDTVIGVEINGESKAYPLFILVWHEIVNEQIYHKQKLMMLLIL